MKHVTKTTLGLLAIVLLATGCGLLFGGMPDVSISSVTPNRGPMAGGATVTIEGSGFYQPVAGNIGAPTSVTVCGAPLTSVRVIDGETRSTLLPGGTSTSILVGGTLTGTTTASSTSGLGDVVVTRPDGQTATLANAYECYLPGPEVNDLAANPSSATTGTAIAFTWLAVSPGNETLACSLDPGDGSAPIQAPKCHLAGNQTSSHTYATSGTFEVTLTVTDETGDTVSARTTVTISTTAPTASFTTTPNAGLAPLEVTFDASASTDPDGIIETYVWDFGDGAIATGIMTTHTFAAFGSFTVALTVTDNEGGTATSMSVVEVNAAPVLDSLSASPNPVVIGRDLTVSWESSDPDGDVLSCSVDFGDGSSTIVDPCPTGSSSVTHAYSMVGSYTVSVAVTDTDGASATASIAVSVTDILWTRQFGTSSGDSGGGVAVGGSGSVLVAGSTSGSLEGTNAGAQDAFVRKLDADGAELWTSQFGTTNSDFVVGPVVDGSGNVIVAGYTFGSLEGASAGAVDVFVRKIDADGTELWTRQFGTDSDDLGFGVAVDLPGNVFVTGYTRGSLEGTTAGGPDVFLRKLNTDGTEVWTRQFGTADIEYGNDVAVDASGFVYLTGTTFGSLEGVNAGGSDVFLRKFDADGAILWTRQFGTNSDESAAGIALDGSGNVLLTGSTGGSLDGASAGGLDVFVRKIGADGADVWTRQFGTTDRDVSAGIAVGRSGNILLTGYTGGSLEGASAGGLDAFIRTFDADGAELWTRQFGTPNYDSGVGIVADGSGNILVAGPTEGSLEGVNAGNSDVYVRKYAP